MTCRLCDPAATSATTTYCDRCSPPPREYRTCERCDSQLMLEAPDRTVCERCRLGRPPEVLEARTAVIRSGEGLARCSSCGKLSALADGRCLLCRLADCGSEILS